MCASWCMNGIVSIWCMRCCLCHPLTCLGSTVLSTTIRKQSPKLNGVNPVFYVVDPIVFAQRPVWNLALQQYFPATMPIGTENGRIRFTSPFFMVSPTRMSRLTEQASFFIQLRWTSGSSNKYLDWQGIWSRQWFISAFQHSFFFPKRNSFEYFLFNPLFCGAT